MLEFYERDGKEYFRILRPNKFIIKEGKHMANPAKELKDLENVIQDLESENKAIRKKAGQVPKLKAVIASYEAQAGTLQRAMVLMDSITRCVERKDDWAEAQAGGACREFLSEMEFKTP